ncbi:MAG: plasmid pRiA4b ORF-3 family protein [Verrucomicrobia bacterium]|nr:plasmid pRiA4b ORF-3 family protein [Verrucomicrobiota bacterium]
MLLPAEDAALFFKLHCALMQFVNEQLKVVGVPESVTPYAALPVGQRRQVVEALVSRLDLIDAFIAANPARLSPEELEIVSSWRHLVSGRFIALRQLQKHMILLACQGTPTAYGLVALVDPMERVIPMPLPAMIETVLLPFRGKITYDGIISSFNVTFGPGSRRRFEQNLRIAKASHRLLTSLPETPAKELHGALPEPKRDRAPRPAGPSPREVLTEVVGMMDDFCQRRLNEEYAALCRKLAEKLAGKRPSPLLRGQPATWACGILRTIGWVNFLADRSQSPHLKLPEIDRAFGVAESTGQGKAKAIRRLLRIHQFDHRWMLPSRWESDPIIWTLQDSRGFMVDIRQQPVAMQREAFRQGLIPYVPADRAAAAVQAQVATSSSRRLFQFKIALREIEPTVWRRIQVLDDTWDRLHEHFQTAMGWTNSHLHEFLIPGPALRRP